MATRTAHGPPFRAEHLGSLLRPHDLLAKREDVDNGKAAQKDLTPFEDKSIKEVVRQQLDIGFHGITDGEYRRHMFWGTFFPNLHGMKEIFNPPLDIFRTYMPDIAAFVEDKAKPGEYHMRYREGQAYSKDAYNNDADYFHDIAVAYQQELGILYQAGLRNVQIDDPNFAYFCSQQLLDGWKEDKANKYTTDELLDTYINFYNECVSKAPKDMHIGVHICRGNFVNSRHFSEGGYDAIAQKLFKELNVSTFYLEYDTARAGTFTPLVHLPANKKAILGVITSKFPQLEDKAKMVDRVREGAKYVAQGTGKSEAEAVKQLGVSPQCGFASHSGGNLLGYDDMLKKLQLVRAIADEVWPNEA
ncbi:MAG: hypothetical protein Q9162_005444 [Coniocarpon cinnabarinum]